MQKKRINSNSFLNKLHRGAVFVCIGVTLYGTFYMGARAYNYYTVVKPALEKAELQKIKDANIDKATNLQC